MAKISTYSLLNTPEGRDRLLALDNQGSTTFPTRQLTLQKLHGFNPSLATGRLTLTSGTPVTTADISGASAATIFYTPTELGDRIALYDATNQNWDLYAFTETSLSLAGIAANTNFDVCAYWDATANSGAGALVLEAIPWTNDTTRSYAVSRQNGIWIKTIDGRRLLGGGRTVAAGQCADTILTRYLCNIYNRAWRTTNVQDSTASWNYNGAFRQTRGIASNRVQFFAGLDNSFYFNAKARGITTVSVANTNVATGIGINSTTVNACLDIGQAYGNTTQIFASTGSYSGYAPVGLVNLNWLEYSSAATTSWYGSSSSPERRVGLSADIWM